MTENESIVDREYRSVLERAVDVRDAREEHGEAVENHEHIAALWSAYLEKDITARDVADCMILMKLSRAHCGEPVSDHYEDVCGYADIADRIANSPEGGEEEENMSLVEGVKKLNEVLSS